MTTVEPSANPPASTDSALAPTDRWKIIAGKIDLIAVLSISLGLGALGLAAAILTIIELAKLTACLWADTPGKYLLTILGVAAIWVAVRWKQLSHL